MSVFNPSRLSSETVLFAVVGMSPAVLTETVWALAHESPPVIPDRLVVLTTSAGRAAVVRDLLTPMREFGGKCVWDCCRAALAKNGLAVEKKLAFGASGQDVRVFINRDPDSNRSRELADIVTPQDNAAVADCLLENLRQFTENPDVRIVASIAGGRKTMGALLFACMSLIGRETDRLTHVLVSEPFDHASLMPRFFFPAQPARVLKLPSGKATVRAASARIMLADIPFVPLRNRFQDIGMMPGAYNRLVARFSRLLKEQVEYKIKLNNAECALTVSGVQVHLRKRAWLTLRFLIDLQPKLQNGSLMQKEVVGDFQEFLTVHDRDWAKSVALADDMKRELSEIRRCFSNAGVTWKPGLRKTSLRLPPFTLLR